MLLIETIYYRYYTIYPFDKHAQLDDLCSFLWMQRFNPFLMPSPLDTICFIAQ